MKVRELHPSEWGRLSETELGPLIDAMPLEHTMVLVVEDDAGEIVGCWGCYSILHVEGLWIRDDHRLKGSVGRRLWTAMRAFLTAKGAGGAVTASMNDDVTYMLERAGARKLPGEHFYLPVRASHLTH